ncbi:putative T7SS-secreted protein [Streptomyces sp. NPDC051211]|uniref:putative T7SS-secreted protein n=1 Tax=Streptomyces sp. NPDC051211 TaxID=3154643 RepID=UPI00344F1D37
MGWRDFTPDFIEDAGEDVVEGIGDGVEWVGDKTADLAEDVGWDDGADWIREKSRSLANSMGAEVAELELDQTEDPKKIIYGSVSKIRENAKHLADFRTNFDKVGKGIKGLNADAIKGVTADSYAEHVAKQPPKWFRAADAFEKAEGALTRFAETVEWAQGQAKDAIEQYKTAKKTSEDARTAYNNKVDEYNDAVKAKKDDLPPRPSGFTDPGAAGIKAAYDKVIEARKQRNEAADTAKAAVEAARDAAPPKPSYAAQVGDGFEAMVIDTTHLVGGVIKGTAGIVNFARSVNPLDPYNLTHPAEYVTNLNNTAAGLVTAVNDPVGTAKNMVDAFQKDPSEGLGKLIPEILGTKGLGMAKKAATVGKFADNGKPSSPGRTSSTDGPLETSRNKTNEIKCDDDPVDVATGRVVLPHTDLVLDGVLPLVFRRTFESAYRAGRWFGPSWASTADQRLEIDAEGVLMHREDGSLLAYSHPAPGLPVLPRHGQRWPLERLPDGGYRVSDLETGHTWWFDEQTPELAVLARQENRNGDWTAFEYDAEGAPRAVAHSGGYRLLIAVEDGRVRGLSLADGTRIVGFGYSGGNLTEVVNASGRPLQFSYDAHDRIVSWTDTNGRRFDYTYDDRHRCVAQVGGNGHIDSRFDYGGRDEATGLAVTAITNVFGHTRRYVINDSAQVVAEIDATGAVRRFEWDGYNRLLVETDPLGHTTRFTYDEQGRLVEMVREDGLAAKAEYDEHSLPVRIVRPDGTVIRQTFDERGNRTSVTEPGGATTLFGYDARGRLESVADGMGNMSRIRCDSAGLPLEITDPLGAVTSFQRDAFGRAVRVVDPVGNTTLLRWSVDGRLLYRRDPDGAERRWDYDGEGNCVRHTDAAGGVTHYEYGDFDLLTARTHPDGTRYTFVHDLDLRLTEVVNPQGLTWSYTYDPAGRLVAEKDFDGRVVSYGYDAASRLTSRKNSLGETIRYERDVLGRIIRKDADGAVTTYEYDLSGRLAVAAGPDSSITWLRDRAGRLVSETVDGREMSFGYDLLGRRVRRTTPTGAVSEWAYDVAGNLASLTANGHGMRFGYDAAGQEIERHIGGTLRLSQSWDPSGRLAGQTVTAGDRLLQHRGYEYRADGHLVSADDSLAGRREFELDQVGRVTAVQAGSWSERYAYDSAGNQTQADWPPTAGRGDARGAREYAGTRVLRAGGQRYEHDDLGRVVLRRRTRLSGGSETWRYSWDTEDRLTSVVTPDGTVWRYRYDPLGRRIAKQRLGGDDGLTVVEEVRFTWDGTNICEQVTSTSDAHVVLTWNHEGLHPIAQTERVLSASQEEVDSRFFAVVTDVIGSPTELLHEDGRVAWRARSTLWGTTSWSRESTAFIPLRFPGQYFDHESGLHYNYFRMYDPETARYLTPDPIGLGPAPNPCAYVPNPQTWSDPLGLAGCHRALGLSSDAQRALEKLENIKRDPVGAINSEPNHNHYSAARREANGEVVARKEDGTPFDHIKDLSQGRNGLDKVRRILEAELDRLPEGLTERGLEVLMKKRKETIDMLDQLNGFLHSIGHRKG